MLSYKKCPYVYAYIYINIGEAILRKFDSYRMVAEWGRKKVRPMWTQETGQRNDSQDYTTTAIKGSFKIFPKYSKLWQNVYDQEF